jgi:hypothetical protein
VLRQRLTRPEPTGLAQQLGDVYGGFVVGSLLFAEQVDQGLAVVRGDGLQFRHRPQGGPRHAAVRLVVRQIEQPGDVRRASLPWQPGLFEQRSDAVACKLAPARSLAMNLSRDPSPIRPICRRTNNGPRWRNLSRVGMSVHWIDAIRAE